MDNFSNSIILPGNLPVIKKETFNKLDKKYLRVVIVRILLFFLVVSGAFVSFVIFSEELPPVLFLIIAGVIIFFLNAYLLLINIIGFPRRGYLVRENDISYQKGVITYSVTTIPFNRIQHVEVTQGVYAKVLGIATIKIYTAGGNASDLSIPGLLVNDANNLKAFLSEKISKHE